MATGNAIGGFYCSHNKDPIKAICFSVEDYHTAVQRRPELYLLAGQQITRIVASSANSAVKAKGVEFAASAADMKKTIRATKEIILAAGALHTPQLFQVSGIWESSRLSSIGVDTVVDLPAVGQNLNNYVLINIINTSMNYIFLSVRKDLMGYSLV